MRVRPVLAALSVGLVTTCAVTPERARLAAREAVVPVQSADNYYVAAAADVDARIASRKPSRARNAIIFIGDGMGISTISSARIYAGQQRGLDGESYRLAMDTLPYTALSKTYSHDYQVPDSAATATAMVAGVKTNSQTLGITQKAAYANCPSILGNGTDTLFEIAERAGLATGLVTTTRLTHATPAAAYAETPDRNWEADTNIRGSAATECADIARQFIEWPHGDGFEIALAGGREQFLPSTAKDPEYPDRTGRRGDGRDLTAEWRARSQGHVYITDARGFAAIDFSSPLRVLGLFEPSHMQYELDRPGDAAGEPSLAEMTRAAIMRLSQDADGYVLMVEGGRIDHAHHGVNAARALADTDAFDQAIAVALEMTDPADTLIIVTADHSHTLTFAGYPLRGNPILGLVNSGLEGSGAKGIDGKPYTTLSYANGQSACRPGPEQGKLDCTRQDLTKIDTTTADFLQPSLVPLMSETHAGEDVAVFARGPGAELVGGVIEQNEIFHIMGRSLGLVAPPRRP